MSVFDIFASGSRQDRFAGLVLRRLQARGWPHAARYDREAFSIDAGGGTGELYLGNIYRDWQVCPKGARLREVDRALNLLFEIGSDRRFEDVADKLLPIVRNLTHLQCTALSSDRDPCLELWQPYATLIAPLGVVLAIDQPTSTALVQTARLADWGVSFEAALERAMDNLIARSSVRFAACEGGFHVSDYRDGYDSSRLLMPELFTAMQLPGDPVAVAVSSACVVVAGSRQTDALKAMAKFVADKLGGETRPTALLPLILRNGHWERFEPGAEVAALRELAVHQTLWDYGAQAPLLERFFSARGDELFVAPLEVAETDDGAPQTWTSWAEGVPARLPRADWVGLAARDARTLFRRWEDIEAVCGPFIEEPGFHPARFSPPAWPEQAAWLRLKREFADAEWVEPEDQGL